MPPATTLAPSRDPSRAALGVLGLACVLLLASPPRAPYADTPAAPDAGPGAEQVEVPDLALRSLPEAARLLGRVGLVLERIHEQRYEQDYGLGLVIQQKPRPGVRLARGAGVRVMVSAREPGPAEGRAPQAADLGLPAALPPAAPGERPPFPLPPPMPVAPTLPAQQAAGAAPAPVAPPVAAPPPTVISRSRPAPAPVPAPGPAPGTEPGIAPRVPLPPVRPGSPDAPAQAERATPGVVPDMLGLPLVDAEQRAREAGLVLYVERVPGHPLGRVLEQVPAAGSTRAAGSVVRVQVTAGGDLPAEARVPVPGVEVTRVTVPDLLDRTPPQAARILQDLGLSLRIEEVDRGLPGRVADQRPAAGSELPKGGVVTLGVARGAALPREAPVGPAAPVPAPAPATTAPRAAGEVPLALGAPAAIAPSEGTALPRQRTLALGFAWQPVEGADAYLLEVEERAASGWLPNGRKIARSSATTMDLERVAPEPGELRWRVRALGAGREGPPSAWVVLR